MEHCRPGLSSQAVLGVILVLLGLLLLGQPTDLYDLGVLFEYVPSLFVLLGLYALVRSGFQNVFGPLVSSSSPVPGSWLPSTSSQSPTSSSTGRCWLSCSTCCFWWGIPDGRLD